MNLGGQINLESRFYNYIIGKCKSNLRVRVSSLLPFQIDFVPEAIFTEIHLHIYDNRKSH